MNAFKRMAIRDEMPLRPGFGTLGKPQTLRANFYAVRITKRIIYDYEIAISPKAQAGAQRRARILDILEQHPQYAPYVGHVAHDRSQRLVSAVKLPQPLSIQVRYTEEGETVPRENPLVFTVDFNFVRELDNNDMTQYVLLICVPPRSERSAADTWMAVLSTRTTTRSRCYPRSISSCSSMHPARVFV